MGIDRGCAAALPGLATGQTESTQIAGELAWVGRAKLSRADVSEQLGSLLVSKVDNVVNIQTHSCLCV